jgi:KUP system potassium uptake protein
MSTPDHTIEAPRSASTSFNVPGLSLAALGVVFGDIGTSPLYTFKTVLDVTGGARSEPAAILGALSRILWTLIIVTSLKYVSLALRIDNGGDGGILALMALLRRTYGQLPVITPIGMGGAALVYGDATITPAISVMSALEGLNIVAPRLQHYVVPATVVILIVLFAVQQQGTARIGRLLGPIMLVWFVTISALGLWGIAQYPAVLWALNPIVGLRYLFSGSGAITLLVVGGVFLCATGAEALYADLGHFGRTPIRLAWSCLFFPALVLNYAGQAAYVLSGAPIDANIFYHLCPAPTLQLPLVLLATVATVIASQAVITGAFSMTRQAIQLGLLPRLEIIQTSAEGHGQIYLPAVNWLLMVITLTLAVSFRSSSNLAAAYGIAVSATMLATTVLLSIAMREIWGWPLPVVLIIGIAFGLVDGGFLSANMMKIAQGGWVPLLLGALICSVMLVWQTGAAAVQRQVDEMQIPISDIVAQIAAHAIPRVAGTAVFVARITRDVPPLVVWHLKHIRSLHSSIIIVNVVSELVPYVADEKRTEVREIAPRMWRVHAHYGFMEQPDLPALLARAHSRDYPVDPSNVTYFIGRETIVGREDRKGLPRIVQSTFAFLLRNSSEAIDYFHLPRDVVVEMGRQFAI